MTTISTIYDSALALVAATISGAQEINFPYELGNNPVGILNNGYAVEMLGDSKAPGEFGGPAVQLSQEIMVTLTRQLPQVDDLTQRKTAEKLILEDKRKLVKAFENNADNNLGVSCDYLTSSGIQYGEASEGGRFLTVLMSFVSLYFDDLST